MRGASCQIGITGSVITGNVKTPDAFFNDIHRLKTHLLKAQNALLTDLPGELFQTMTDATDQLTAITTGSSPANAMRLQQHYVKTPLGQFQCGIHTGKSTTQYTDLGIQ